MAKRTSRQLAAAGGSKQQQRRIEEKPGIEKLAAYGENSSTTKTGAKLAAKRGLHISRRQWRNKCGGWPCLMAAASTAAT